MPIRNLWSLEPGECIVVEEAVIRFTEKVLAFDSRLQGLATHGGSGDPLIGEKLVNLLKRLSSIVRIWCPS